MFELAGFGELGFERSDLIIHIRQDGGYRDLLGLCRWHADLIGGQLSLPDFEKSASTAQADETLSLRTQQVIEELHVRVFGGDEVLEALVGCNGNLIDCALADRGLTQEQVSSRLAQLSPQDLHQLAQNLDQLQAAGLTKQEWTWIAIGAIAVLIIIIAV